MATSTEAPPAGAPASPPRAPQRREHRFDVDLLRLVASCSVILSHVSATFIHAVDTREANGAGAYWVGMAGDAAGSFAVPVFFAIAGWAVLVGAPPRDGARLWRRLTRNLVPLFVWTAAYLAWAWLRGTNEKPMTDLAVDAGFGTVQPAYHLWFMYPYLVIVALLGFVVLIRQGQRPWGMGLLLLGVAALPTALTTLGELTDRGTPAVGWGFSTYAVVYAVGGALLLSLPGRLAPGWRRLLLALAPLAVAGILWYDTQIHYVIPNAHLFVGALTLCVALPLVRIEVPRRLRPTVQRVASAALGAYLVHVFFVEELVRPLVSADLSGPACLALLVGMLAVTVVLSYGVSLLWGRLGLRRILG
ncbi:acyltransferase [Streptomyces hoynatensis]|uniref:Acyltransferase n=1 Tax=Streptomyces hoynatensis TaxID=1141874 RepID=A0A3A9YQJ9_9ACTN|nr:acyltransferase [Streptomyces hoynatensis]RKN37506.1 acyltransferase [Streptomyces hoynatensis]